MLPYLRERFGNPSSGHAFGRLAREAVETARGRVASLLACDTGEVVFTSGGTESNNLAIRGATEARPERRHVLTSSIEHPAVAAPCAWLERHGWEVTRAGVDGEGRIRPDETAAAIRDDSALVTIMHANNETGVLQPVAEIARAARERGAVVHTDAAQSAGKVPISVGALGVDLLSVAGHKLYAPKGVGALYVRRGTLLWPFTLGAGHEQGLRPGTENVASIVGLGVACERAARDLDAEGARLRALRDELWGRLLACVAWPRAQRAPDGAASQHAERPFPGRLRDGPPRRSAPRGRVDRVGVPRRPGAGVPGNRRHGRLAVRGARKRETLPRPWNDARRRREDGGRARDVMACPVARTAALVSWLLRQTAHARPPQKSSVSLIPDRVERRPSIEV